MARVTEIAESLDRRRKDAVKTYNLDIVDLAGRTLAEGFLRHWRVGLGEAPWQLNGGDLFCQTIRATSDADITTVRRYLPHEFRKGAAAIADLLAREGIELHVADAPQYIDVGSGDPVTRWKLRGRVGGVAARSQIDMTYGHGPDAFSRDNVIGGIPSQILKVPSLRANCQPLHAATAEKPLAVICQPESDMRVKHAADLADERLGVGVNSGVLSRELQRVCRHRGIDPTALPDTLDVADYERLRDNWVKYDRPGEPKLSFDGAFKNIGYLWSEVRDCMFPSQRPLPRSMPTPVIAKRRIGGMR